MPWYVHLALKQLFPAGRRFPFFTAISVLGVALGVALLIVVTSVMAGVLHGDRAAQHGAPPERTVEVHLAVVECSQAR